MTNFIGYMFFSSLEYFALIVIIFSVFNFKFKNHKLLIAALTLASTGFSYIFTITELYKYVPIPIILAIPIAYILSRIFNDKFSYCIIAFMGGSVVYLLLQISVITLAVSSGFITYIDTSNPYSFHTYTIQSICALIGIAIAVYVRITHSGFGFSFYKIINRKFVIVSSMTLLSCSIVYSVSIHQQSAQAFISTISLAIVATAITIYFSYQQDKIEFS